MEPRPCNSWLWLNPWQSTVHLLLALRLTSLVKRIAMMLLLLHGNTLCVNLLVLVLVLV